VVAKTPYAKTELGKQFFNKTTQRTYQALVWGVPNSPTGRIESQITRNPKDRLQMAVSFDPEVGKHAVTHYTMLENYSYTSLIECRLETGRTHQIRVHMKHLGHPLFNDERYGGDIVLKGTTFSRYRQFIQHCFDTCPRQALHAKTLGFVHPVTGEQMSFDSELPTDMKQLVEGWREYINTMD
jgi:23S rRNA pseudouridine1911/1915/1917 synthase